MSGISRSVVSMGRIRRAICFFQPVGKCRVFEEVAGRSFSIGSSRSVALLRPRQPEGRFRRVTIARRGLAHSKGFGGSCLAGGTALERARLERIDEGRLKVDD